MRYIQVRLIRKLADHIHGFDLSKYDVGDVFEVPSHTALMLMGVGWATPLESALLRSRDLSRPKPGRDIDVA
jgi:hypothetical protein